MVEYTVRRKVLRIGKRKTGSLVVVLPRIWTQAHGIVKGDTVTVAFSSSYNFLKVIPKGNEKESLKVDLEGAEDVIIDKTGEIKAKHGKGVRLSARY